MIDNFFVVRPPDRTSPPAMADKIHEPSITTTMTCGSRCKASSMNSGSQPDDRQLFCRAPARSDIPPSHGGQNPRAIDHHYHDLRLAMQGVFHELGIAA